MIPWSKVHYHLRDGKVRWHAYEVKGADVGTFEPLNHIWARDAKRVYTQHSVNKLADRESFEVLNHVYAKDKARVFYLSGWIKEADVKTFRVLDEGRMLKPEFARASRDEVAWDYEGFACDASSVFYDEMLSGKPCVLRGAAPAQFKVLSHGFGGDAKTVFYKKWRIKGAATENFQILNRFYSTDGQKVFYLERIVPGADKRSFEVLADCWARDAKQPFFQEHPMAKADASTFAVINQSFARDADHVFGWTGELIEGAEAKTFERIGDSLFYRDKRGVYYSGYPGGWLEGADPTSFEVGPRPDEGRDRQWVYHGNDRKGPRDTGAAKTPAQTK